MIYSYPIKYLYLMAAATLNSVMEKN